MTTDNTQSELDVILAKHNGELGVTWEDPDVVTPDTKQALLDWHNKQIEAVLDRLDKSMPTSEQLTTKYGYHMPEKQYGYKIGLHDIREVIEAERNKLKESKGEQ